MRLQDIRRIAIVGSGIMGPGIAQSFAKHGYHVSVCDTRQQALQTARSVMSANLRTLSRHGLVETAEIEAIENRVVFTTSLEDAVREADFVVECVTENREVKRAVFQQLGGMCARNAIFASNTSYLNIFELVPEDRLPNTVIAHWFAPPHILPLVEVVREAHTSEQTEKVVLELLRAIGKVPVVMKKYVPGHAVNRILRIIGREVFFLLDNGYITAEQLDLAVKASIAPRMMLLGVVQRYDFTGLDLSAGNLRNEEYMEAPIDNEPKSLSNLVKQGHWGVKTGKGFYDYQNKSLADVLEERDDSLLKILKCAAFCLDHARGQTNE
jgi:3-hydroxybutyryl-CoA dehydrogenase